MSSKVIKQCNTHTIFTSHVLIFILCPFLSSKIMFSSGKVALLADGAAVVQVTS